MPSLFSTALAVLASYAAPCHGMPNFTVADKPSLLARSTDPGTLVPFPQASAVRKMFGRNTAPSANSTAPGNSTSGLNKTSIATSADNQTFEEWLDEVANADNAPIANSTNTLGVFDWLTNPTAGVVNVFSRGDCQNPCVETMFCSGTGKYHGDLVYEHWNMDSGIDCWDVPAGANTIGLAATKESKGYVSSGWTCEQRAEAIKTDVWDGFATQPLETGEGDASKKQQCNFVGSEDGIKSVIFLGAGDD